MGDHRLAEVLRAIMDEGGSKLSDTSLRHIYKYTEARELEAFLESLNNMDDEEREAAAAREPVHQFFSDLEEITRRIGAHGMEDFIRRMEGVILRNQDADENQVEEIIRVFLEGGLRAIQNEQSDSDEEAEDENQDNVDPGAEELRNEQANSQPRQRVEFFSDLVEITRRIGAHGMEDFIRRMEGVILRNQDADENQVEERIRVFLEAGLRAIGH
ncbi:hypothetical protein GCK72_000113 [Caenorhabditis remanei]|uniref:Uncharacterized protein n=1 Tax=Caenorhabditis remanei TaxID=31234 RepID=A0A6A5HMB6_CAERE|nr:hypothetical protein GCK72_000113 [Caenorhabditis remanei]KAF1768301.1 hypothetical protein GCK72_000113 [Caenorhabditis remanei]